MNRLNIFVCLLSTLLISRAQDQYYDIEALPKVNVSDFEQYWFDSLIDHFNYQDERTFIQRMWVNDKYYNQSSCNQTNTCNGPVFLYICGEYTCSIREDRLFPFMVGASHGAILYALEHRFYGKSQPFQDLSTSNLRYLSTEQALSDIAAFIKLINQFTPDRPVVVIGGSYPGALSAWFRQRYPQMTVASWSSSGVVYPIKDFWKFDEQIFIATNNTSPVCTSQIQKTFKQVMNSLNQTGNNNPKIYFGSDLSMNDGDFAFFFADIFVESVQYGNRTGLCNIFLNSSQNGDHLIPYLSELKTHAFQIGVDIQDYDRRVIKNTTITGSSARAWTYQYCSEFGWYQTPSKEHAMRPALLNTSYWTEMCHDIYNITLHLNRSVQEFAFNHQGGSNTVFTNGGDDPWQWATELNPDISLNQIGLISDCVDCGHCAELYTPKSTDQQQLKQVRQQVMKFIDQILKKNSQNDLQKQDKNQIEESQQFLQF